MQSIILILFSLFTLNTLAIHNIENEIEGFAQEILSSLAGDSTHDVGRVILGQLKNKAISTVENKINTTANDFIKDNTEGKTNLSVRNLHTDNPSIRFVTIQQNTVEAWKSGGAQVPKFVGSDSQFIFNLNNDKK